MQRAWYFKEGAFNEAGMQITPNICDLMAAASILGLLSGGTRYPDHVRVQYDGESDNAKFVLVDPL